MIAQTFSLKFVVLKSSEIFGILSNSEIFETLSDSNKFKSKFFELNRVKFIDQHYSGKQATSL